MEMEVVPENSGSLKRTRPSSSSGQCTSSGDESKEIYHLVDLKDTSQKFTIKEKKIKTASKQHVTLVESKSSGSKNSLKGEVSKTAIQSLGDKDSTKLYYDKRDKGPFLIFIRKLADKKTSSALSVIKISRLLYKANIRYKEIIPHSWNTWRVTCDSRDEANAAIKNRFLDELGLICFIPRYMVYRKGVIKQVDLDIPLIELRDIIKLENPAIRINNLFRLKRKDFETKKWVDSESICLEFRGQELPPSVSVWKCRLRITPYIPPVRRCYNCGKFGHLSKGCSVKEAVCLNCGVNHAMKEDKSCDSSPKCINCSEDHHTLNGKCLALKNQQEVNRIMAVDNVSYLEAKRSFEQIQGTSGSLALKDLSNFPRLKRLQSSFADKIKNTAKGSSPQLVAMEEVFCKINTAPDQDQLLKRILHTIKLHLEVQSLSNAASCTPAATNGPKA